MLFEYFLSMFVHAVAFLFSWLPNVDVLPYGVDEYLVSGVGYYRYVADFFPPFTVMLSAFLAVMGVKLILFSLRLFRIIR